MRTIGIAVILVALAAIGAALVGLDAQERSQALFEPGQSYEVVYFCVPGGCAAEVIDVLSMTPDGWVEAKSQNGSVWHTNTANILSVRPVNRGLRASR